jgi:hypothetical protein
MKKADALESKDCDMDGLHGISRDDGHKLARFYLPLSFGPMVRNRSHPQN